MKLNSLIFALSISIFLTACGGGSSSGGEPPKELTYCVSESIIENNFEFDDAVITRSEHTYTNFCNEPVNLSLGYITVGSIEHIPLGINDSHVKTSVFNYSYIACRPPSIGIDEKGGVGLEFKCS